MGRFNNFMNGRNGNDEFGRFLSLITMILLIVSLFTRIPGLYIVALAFLIFSYFRIFSKNLEKRQAENDWFLDRKDSIASFFSGARRQARDRDHRYFKCPRCGKKLRVPRGRGRISIHCPSCGCDFIKIT